jgi:hypothetical protein
MSKVIWSFAAAALMSAAPMTEAKLVTWTLDGVGFEDNGIATGAFTLDTSHIDQTRADNPVESFDIKVTATDLQGATLQYPASEYSSFAPGAANLSFYAGKEANTAFGASVTLVVPDPTDPTNPDKILRTLGLSFDSDLTATVGTHRLNGGYEMSRAVVGCCRLVFFGSVSAVVPEPSGSAFVGFGAIVLCLIVYVTKQRAP